MDDRLTVDLVKGGRDTVFQFVPECDADMAEHGTGEPVEETLHEIDPGAVLGRGHECEATIARLGEARLGLSRDVGGMSPADEPDCGCRRIGSIELSGKRPELARTWAFVDTGMNRAGQKIDVGQ